VIERLWEKYKNGELSKVIRFCLVGVCNTAVDFFIFWTMTEWVRLSVYIAQVMAYCIATGNSYLLNSSWTFGNGRHYSWSQFIKFIAVNLTSLLTSLLLLFIFNDIMNWDKMVTKVVIAFFTFAINYLGNRFWVFHYK